MTNDYTINGEQITIQTAVPFKTLTDMEIDHRFNEHASIRLRVTVDSEKSDEVLYRDWSGTKIQAWKQGEDGESLFTGLLTRTSCRRENQLLTVEMEGVGETAVLDREKKKRSFQDAGMTYRQVVQEVLKDYPAAECIWGAGTDKAIAEPLVQYEETDWEFIKRLASHFHGGLVPDTRTGRAAFAFCMKTGKERHIDETEVVNCGFDDAYYRNGCCEDKVPRTQAFYMEVRTKENWQLGDFGYYGGGRYCAYQRSITFRQGELGFACLLGAPGMYYRKKKCNAALTGVRLEGVITRTEEEKVYLQLDIDEKQQDKHPWAWAPETNNLCYCMPEKETRAALYFPTEEEKDGTAVLAVVHNSQNARYADTQKKEFVTKDDKKLKLYPDKITLEGKDNKALFLMEDMTGIQIKSDSDISFAAEGNVFLEGQSISMTAPVEVTCRTAESNIELCRDINLFAPGGVKTIGTGEGKMKADVPAKGGRAARQKTEYWQAAYSAMAAIPALDFQEGAEQETLARLFAFSAIPKVGGGDVTVAMSEVMDGTKAEEASFPTVFQSMDNYTVKGGYLLPEEEG